MNKALLVVSALASLLVVTSAAAETERREMGNLVVEDVPEIPEAVRERLFQYQNTRSVGFQSWDPNGGVLVSTRFGETAQLHHVAGPGMARRQLTFFPEPVGGAEMSPDPKRHGFLFTKDVGGSEFYQIFWFDLDKGNWRLLTNGRSKYGGIEWSRKGDRFAYFGTERNGKDWDIHIMDPAQPKKARRVLAKGGTWYPLQWSPDDDQILVRKYVSINESYLYVMSVRNGRLKQVNPSKDKIAYEGGVWSRDGKSIWFASDQDSEFLRLRHYDVRKKEQRVITGDIPWDVSGVAASPSADWVAFTVNEGGVDRLYLLDTKTEKYEKVEGLPVGQIGGLEFHPDGRRLALVLNTPKTPGDLYVLDVNTRKATRWTQSEVGGLDTSQFVEPTLIEYETFDEVDGAPRKIPAFYYRPKGRGPHPVVIYIHGGPEGQFVPYFSSTVQYYVNELGIAVLAPNVRGSAGYGKSYLKLDNGMLREDTVKDIGKLLDWIGNQRELDAKHVAVQGGSYGGYMVLASMIHFNDRLVGGVDLVGISNFVTFLENTQDYRRDLRRAEYGDERVPEMRKFLESISPTTQAGEITKPMLIAQGTNDPRVPVTESEQMVAKIRGGGGAVWYILAKDEGHGFRKKSNRDYYNQAVVLFYEQHLLGRGRGTN